MPEDWTVTTSSVLAAISTLTLIALMVFGAYLWVRRGTPGRLLLALARQSPRRRLGIAAVAGTAVTAVSLVEAAWEGITGAWLLAAGIPPGAVFGLGLWLVPPRMQRHMQGQDQERT